MTINAGRMEVAFIVIVDSEDEYGLIGCVSVRRTHFLATTGMSVTALRDQFELLDFDPDVRYRAARWMGEQDGMWNYANLLDPASVQQLETSPVPPARRGPHHPQKREDQTDYIGWANSFPRQLLIDRKIIEARDRGADVVAKLLSFFSVTSPTAYAKTWLEPQASYKLSQVHSIDPNLTALWLRLAEFHACAYLSDAPRYDPAGLRSAANLIPELTVHDAKRAFLDAQAALLNVGVVLVFVPEIPNTRISGVSRWINGTPTIAVTSRYKTYDGLWFTILHEIAHVLLHPKRSTFIDDLKVNDDADSQETAANSFAQDHLIPQTYQDMLSAATTATEIISLAGTLGVSPSIVAGQWAFQTGNWRGPIAKLRERVDLAEALTSGH